MQQTTQMVRVAHEKIKHSIWHFLFFTCSSQLYLEMNNKKEIFLNEHSW